MVVTYQWTNMYFHLLNKYLLHAQITFKNKHIAERRWVYQIPAQVLQLEASGFETLALVLTGSET